MNKAKKYLQLYISLLTFGFSFTFPIISEAKSPPNFVLIFMDDQGYQDVGVFGSKTIKTPNLDNMAKEGMKFTDFYSLAAVCSPSRAGLMTGCYPPRVGITKVLFPRDKIGLNPNETTIAGYSKPRTTLLLQSVNGILDISLNSFQQIMDLIAIMVFHTQTIWME